jgi:flagellar P-ring protein FlgI
MRRLLFAILTLVLAVASPAAAQEVRIKDLGRFLGDRDNALTGYGLVVGLSGTGDSPRSVATRQAFANVLGRLGANIPADQLQSRNVAVVIVTATLPASANVGDRIDLSVSSVGDARSLVGGSLLLTELKAANDETYALAQGPLTVGGYRFDADANSQQRNYPASGVMTGGATVERSVRATLLGTQDELVFILRNPDVTTAERVAAAINGRLGGASVIDASSIRIDTTGGPEIYRTIAAIENMAVVPDSRARVVVNERSGTVVAGGGVRISDVVISQGDIRVKVSVDNRASQPMLIGGVTPGARSLIVTNTRLDVSEGRDTVVSFPNTTVADLVEGLVRVNVDTRGVISILQAMKAAGALHADVVVQ